jgi:hypothetical protein
MTGYRLTLAINLVALGLMLTGPSAAWVRVSSQLQANSLGHAPAVVAATTANLPLFETETAAQKHCPSGTVVWLNLRSGIYHLKGERWYGTTKYGAYVCKREADAAGDRETENGQ